MVRLICAPKSLQKFKSEQFQQKIRQKFVKDVFHDNWNSFETRTARHHQFFYLCCNAFTIVILALCFVFWAWIPPNTMDKYIDISVVHAHNRIVDHVRLVV